MRKEYYPCLALFLIFSTLLLTGSSHAALTKEDLNEIRGIMKEELGHVNKRLDDMDKRLDSMDKRLDGMDKRLDGMDKRLDGMDKRLDEGLGYVNKRIDEGLGHVNKRIDEGLGHVSKRIDEGLGHVNKRIDDLYTLILWGFGVTFTGMFALIGFVLWDRRSAIRPFQRDVREAEDKITKLEKALKEYSIKEPELETVLRNIGLL